MLQKIHIISLFLVTALYAQNADKYEPNNDFSSAYPISFGDSVVVNASVFGTDTVVTDPSLCDIDYYRIALDSGKIVQFYIFPIDYTCFDFNVGMNFQLFDSSKDLVYSDIALRCPVDGMTIPGYGVTKTGTYYLRIRIKKLTNPYNGPATNYGLSVHQRDNKNILTVLSPNGGETFNGGDYVKVKWQHDSTLFTKRDIRVQYSIDNGKSWRNAWYESLFDSVTSNYTDDKWRIPHLKYRTDQALLRVISRDIPNASFGISKGTFTILASKNDMYEPNDDFSTARAITLGDSVVQNGIVMKGYTERDSSIIDTTLTDVDFFKIYLEAGKHVTIKDVFSRGTEEVCWENECDDMFNAPAVISLYDASKNQIGMSSISSLTCGISHSGIYYCKIVPGDGDDYWNRYSLSIHQSDPITIISPKGGEHFQAGQKIQINWTSDSTFWYFNLYFSVNNGISWNLYMNTKSTGVNSSSWVIPAFKNRTDQALIKIEIPNVVNQFSCISKPFTILPASADAYEPNNDRASAYPIALGDSIIKNASIFIYDDSTVLNSGYWSDIDNYKVNLTAEALLHIQSWPDTTSRTGGLPEYIFYNTGDSSGILPESLLKRNNEKKKNQFFHVNQSGVYNLEVNPYRWAIGDYGEYGFSIKSMSIIAFRSFVLDTDDTDSTQSYFSGHYTDDFTKLTFYCSQKKNNFVYIRTMFLSPDDFSPLADELLKVKCLAVFCDNARNNQNVATISIPYDPADLNGYPESSLAVAYLDYMESDQFLPVSDSIDTINHRITVQLPYLQCGILQVYVKGDVAVNDLPKVALVSGIKTRYVRSQKSLAINLSLPVIENVELRLYNILGKCIQKSTLKAGSGYSTHLWNLKGLPNGKYVLAIKAGKYRKQETLMVLY